MAFNAVLLLCASALLFNTISGQCIGSAPNAGYAGNGLAGYGAGLDLAGNNFAGCNAGYGSGNGYAANLGNFASLSGGELLVSSSSALAPSGLSVMSENTLEGVLNAAGALPFLSAVALEGPVPSGGSAGVSYSCGNGNVSIVGANGSAAAGGSGYGAGLAGAGLANIGLAGAGLAKLGLAGGYTGCGCNALY